MQEDFKFPSAELKLLSSVSLSSFSVPLENSVICSVICIAEVRYLYIRSIFSLFCFVLLLVCWVFFFFCVCGVFFVHVGLLQL